MTTYPLFDWQIEAARRLKSRNRKRYMKLDPFEKFKPPPPPEPRLAPEAVRHLGLDRSLVPRPCDVEDPLKMKGEVKELEKV